mmetsp:Transcript_3411/g.21298  ORF Transcript_3411/g.21298 Transcript_3411/m.21298 type:complete len:276 (+) Transcript_3411:1451-2278(+)
MTSKGSTVKMPLDKYDGRNLFTSSLEYPNVIWVKSFVPKEKNSACSAISSATRAALGTSIIVPTRYATLTPSSEQTLDAMSRIRPAWWASSCGVPTSGTMISGLTSTPSFFTLQAAWRIARACISAISGYVIPKRHPRNPSMGLTSDSFSMRSCTSSGLQPDMLAISWTTSSASPSGKNSCSGGSSSRIVTGRPSIARKIPSKSLLWYGRRSSSAAFLDLVSTAMIIRLTALMRSAEPKNMCSVRTRPIPSAPFFRAAAASSGVSAFANTFNRLY